MVKPKFKTPVGEVKFRSYIETPNEHGKYTISIVLDPKEQEYQDMLASLEEAEKDFEKKYRGKGHSKPNIDLVDGEKVATDKVLMQFKSAFALWDENGSKVYDAKGKPVRETPGWGSKVRVAFSISPYDVSGKTGITKYIAGIQIIDLKTSDQTSEGCGFKEEEGHTKEVSEPQEIGWDE